MDKLIVVMTVGVNAGARQGAKNAKECICFYLAALPATCMSILNIRDDKLYAPVQSACLFGIAGRNRFR
ncbi:MAG: hypothetical protein RI909_502, partial [Bacteroidota bacterium]